MRGGAVRGQYGAPGARNQPFGTSSAIVFITDPWYQAVGSTSKAMLMRVPALSKGIVWW